MIPYILLLAIPFFFCVIAFQKKQQMVLEGYAEDKEYIRSMNWALAVFFWGIFFLLALRHELIGNDTMGYRNMFDSYRVQSLKTALSSDMEALFVLLNWLVGRLTDDFQWFLALVAAITLFPIATLYTEEREHSFLKIVLFLNLPTFIMMFSGIRQMLAVAFGVAAYKFVRKKKWLPFLLMVLIAVGFHKSAVVLVLLYPLYHVSFKKKHLWLIIPAIVLVFIFNEPIFLFLANTYGSYLGESITIGITETGAYTMLILFILCAVFAYVIPDEKRMDRESIALRNILVLAVVLQCFAAVHSLAMRMNYYFIIFIPIAMPKFIASAKDEFVHVAKWGEGAMDVFFAAYFIWGIWESYSTGISTLGTVPYIPFWQY